MIEITYNGEPIQEITTEEIIREFKKAGYRDLPMEIIEVQFIDARITSFAPTVEVSAEFAVLVFNKDEDNYVITSLFINEAGAEFGGNIDRSFADEDEAAQAWVEWISG